MLKGTPLLSFSFLTLLLPPIISIYPISLLFLSRFSADARYWYRLSNRGVRSTMSMTWKISLRTLIRWWPVSRPSMSRDYDIMVKAALMPVCFVVCCCFFCCLFSSMLLFFCLRLYVTFRYDIKTAQQHIIILSSAYVRPIILVFLVLNTFVKFRRGHPPPLRRGHPLPGRWTEAD